MNIPPPVDEPARIPRALLFACGTALILYLGSYMRIPLVPLFAERMGASTADVGLINAGFMLTAALLSIPLGLLSDRIGRRILILAGMMFSCLTSVLLLSARTPLQVGLIYLFSGVGLACFSPAMMSHVADTVPARFLGRAYGWYTSAIYLGMALGPGLGGAIGARGFETAFVVSALILGGGAVAWGLRRTSLRAPVQPRSGTGNLRAGFLEIVRIRTVLACWATTFFSTYAWGSLFAFFPLYAKESGISVSHTGLIFTTQAAVNALVRIPAGHLQDRRRDRRAFILWGNILFGLCIALTGVLRREIALYLLFAAVGGAMAFTFTAIGTVLSESVEIRVRGLAMGGYNTCIYGGFMASAATTGIVMEHFGYAAGFASAGLVCAVSTGVAWLPRKTGKNGRITSPR
jgi:DHA1 family multidrug resistance protein-like MFS transporter